MHYNEFLFASAESELRDQILQMAPQFTSKDFIEGFVRDSDREYEALVARYRNRYDHPHAEQIAHREITHTLRNKFQDLVIKTGDCKNPKGGTMSQWRRL
jgi:hypothetical protein